jgi:hypothetical protein
MKQVICPTIVAVKGQLVLNLFSTQPIIGTFLGFLVLAAFLKFFPNQAK